MIPARPLACVLGDMDLVRPLGRAGIPCAVVARRFAPQRFSRFAAIRVEWFDAWEQGDALTEALIGFAKAQDEPPVLFYEEDRELLLISRRRAELSKYLRFVVADAALVEGLVDKSRFQELAARLDLPVPRAMRFSALGTSPSDLPLRFPIIVKPLTRRTDQWEPVAGSAKALVVESRGALAVLWPRLATFTGDLLAQELVPGGEERIESYHVYVAADGAVRGEFTGRKLRTHPVRYGHSTALVTTDAPDVAALGRELVERLQLRGVAKFDFKRDPDGRLLLLEVNPRFNLWHHLGAAAGVNLPALVYDDLTGERRRPAARARAGLRWTKPWRDVSAARQMRVPLHSWIAWTLGAEAKRLIALDDPLPLLLGGLLHWVPSRVPTRDVPPARG